MSFQLPCCSRGCHQHCHPRQARFQPRSGHPGAPPAPAWHSQLPARPQIQPALISLQSPSSHRALPPRTNPSLAPEAGIMFNSGSRRSTGHPQARPRHRGRAGSVLLARPRARLRQEAPLEREAPGSSRHHALPAASCSDPSRQGLGRSRAGLCRCHTNSTAGRSRSEPSRFPRLTPKSGGLRQNKDERRRRWRMEPSPRSSRCPWAACGMAGEGKQLSHRIPGCAPSSAPATRGYF